MSCRVLVGVQEDPDTAVGVLLVGDGPALYALPDGVHRGSEMLGGFLDAGSRGGRWSCRVLSGVLSHAGILDPSGPLRRPEGGNLARLGLTRRGPRAGSLSSRSPRTRTGSTRGPATRRRQEVQAELGLPALPTRTGRVTRCSGACHRRQPTRARRRPAAPPPTGIGGENNPAPRGFWVGSSGGAASIFAFPPNSGTPALPSAFPSALLPAFLAFVSFFPFFPALLSFLPLPALLGPRRPRFVSSAFFSTALTALAGALPIVPVPASAHTVLLRSPQSW